MTAAPSAGRGRVLLLRVFLGAMIAAVAYVGVQAFLQRPVEIPESVGGVARLHDALARNFAEQMRTDAERFDLQVETGAFGERGKAEFLVVVVNEGAGKATEEMFRSFTRGFTQGGAVVGQQERKGEVKGAGYRCVSAVGGGQQAGVCMWRTDSHVGFVADLDGTLKTAQELTARVYRAVE